MKQQHDHRVMSSLALFLDNRLLTSGEAFFNHTGSFYPTTSSYAGRTTYSLPFKQIVNDQSVPNALPMSGIYLNGNYITVGQSGLLNINHYQGTVDFSSALSPNTSITGSFSVKEANIYLTTDSDEKIVYYNKYFKNAKYPQNLSGLLPDVYPLPAIFLKKRGGEEKSFSLGSVDNSVIDVRAIIVSDNNYLSDGIASIFKDTHFRRFPLITPPFDARGAFTGIYYNYTGLSSGLTNKGPLIEKVRESRISASDDKQDGDLGIVFIDFEISQVRSH